MPNGRWVPQFLRFLWSDRQIPALTRLLPNGSTPLPVVKHGNEYIMLFRSHLRTGRSIIGLARNPDGFHFTAAPEPFLVPDREGPFATL